MTTPNGEGDYTERLEITDRGQLRPNGGPTGRSDSVQVHFDHYSGPPAGRSDVQFRIQVDGGSRNSSASLHLTADVIGELSHPPQCDDGCPADCPGYEGWKPGMRRRIEDVTITLTKRQLHELASQLSRYAHQGRA